MWRILAARTVLSGYSIVRFVSRCPVGCASPLTRRPVVLAFRGTGSSVLRVNSCDKEGDGARDAEEAVEAVVGPQRNEALVLLAATAPEHLHHGRRQVVVVQCEAADAVLVAGDYDKAAVAVLLNRVAVLKLRSIRSNDDFPSYWAYHLAQKRRRVDDDL